MNVDSSMYELNKYQGDNLRTDTLIEEPVEVVRVKAGSYVRVPLSMLLETTKITYQGTKPYIHAEDDGQLNLILTMPQNTTLKVKFLSESRGQLGHRTKLIYS